MDENGKNMTKAMFQIKNKPVLLALIVSAASSLSFGDTLPAPATTTTTTTTAAAPSKPVKHKKHLKHKKHHGKYSYTYSHDSYSQYKGTAPVASASHFSTWNWRVWQGSSWHPVFSIAGGASQSADVGSGSPNFPATLDPVAGQFYNYNSRQPSQTTGLLDVFAGLEWPLSALWLWQSGLAYDQSSYHSYGTLTQGVDIPSEIVTPYRYNIINRQILFENKLLFTAAEIIHPYVLLGAGMSLNYASDFSTFVPSPNVTRNFSVQNNTAFTYNAGVGIDVNMTKTFRVGMGYRFSDLGKSKLGSSAIDGTSVPGTLSQSHMYTSEVIGQFTWVLQ
jgi:hypothetical protein